MNFNHTDKRNTDKLAKHGISFELTDEEDYTLVSDPYEGTTVIPRELKMEAGGQSFTADEGIEHDYLPCSINSDQFIGLFILWKTRHVGVGVIRVEATAADKVIIRFNRK
jgi:hypothetical protein